MKEGIHTVLEALFENGTLEKISFDHVGGGEDCALSLANLLMQNSTLQEVGMAYNGLTDKVCETLAQALRSNHSLKIINLSYNDISEAGARLFIQALEANEVLEQVNLKFNLFEDTPTMEELKSKCRSWPAEGVPGLDDVVPAPQSQKEFDQANIL